MQELKKSFPINSEKSSEERTEMKHYNKFWQQALKIYLPVELRLNIGYKENSRVSNVYMT